MRRELSLAVVVVLPVYRPRQFSVLLSVERVGICGSGKVIFFYWCRSVIMRKDVLNNTGNDYEFVGNFRPPERSTRETIKLLLYNREAGTVLGRTGTSWGKNFVYLFCNSVFVGDFCLRTSVIMILQKTRLTLHYKSKITFV